MQRVFAIVICLGLFGRAALAQHRDPGSEDAGNNASLPGTPQTEEGSRTAAPSTEEQTEIELFAYEELLNPKVDIAGRVAQSAQEAASIVTVLTQDDIRAFGARDLADVLRLVPGFELGVDVISLIGLSFRGIWAMEGKLLLMTNGSQINDYAFGNEQMIGTVPASLIQRVEIIRGPGSALYGGFAEVAVINVITHSGAKLDGVRLTGEAGLVGSDGFAREGNISVGTKREDYELAMHIGKSFKPLSTRTYQDFFGGELRFGESTSPRDWMHIFAQGRAKGFSFNYVRLNFDTTTNDSFVAMVPPVDGVNSELANFRMDTLLAQYQWAPVEHLEIVPSFEYATGTASAVGVLPTSSLGPYTNIGGVLQRYRAALSGAYQLSQGSQATLGLGFIRDAAYNIASTTPTEPGFEVAPGELRTRVQSNSAFLFGQYIQSLGPFALTVGARYENTTFGAAFAPRLGITFVAGAFNAKLLYGRAFRIPTLWQAYARTFNRPPEPLRPETANTAEAELGYRFTQHLLAKVNAFYTRIDKPLVYNGGVNSFLNLGVIATTGAEAELEWRHPDFGGFVNVAYNRPSTDTSEGFVTPDGRHFVASPALKANVGGHYRLGILQFGATLTLLSERHGQSQAYALGLFGPAADPDTAFDIQTYPALALLNINFSVVDIVPGLSMHFKVHNLLDAPYTLIQPYYGGHAPLPADDRQFTFGFAWSIP